MVEYKSSSTTMAARLSFIANLLKTKDGKQSMSKYACKSPSWIQNDTHAAQEHRRPTHMHIYRQFTHLS